MRLVYVHCVTTSNLTPETRFFRHKLTFIFKLSRKKDHLDFTPYIFNGSPFFLPVRLKVRFLRIDSRDHFFNGYLSLRRINIVYLHEMVVVNLNIDIDRTRDAVNVWSTGNTTERETNNITDFDQIRLHIYVYMDNW